MKSLLPPTWPILSLAIKEVWKRGPWHARWMILGYAIRAVVRWWKCAPGVPAPPSNARAKARALGVYARARVVIPQELLDQQEGSANLVSNQPPPKQEP